MNCQIKRQIYMPWADGTKCDSGKWCDRGECLEGGKPESINGGWSDWKT